MRRPLIAGNWKMHGTLASNSSLLGGLLTLSNDHACEVTVCVPYPYLALCKGILGPSSITWSAQDVSMHESGAYTGEVSASMLADFDCRYVVIGHSERRSYHHESDASVAQKTKRVLQYGMSPIVCVGETLSEREAGITEGIIKGQVAAVLDVLSPDEMSRLVIAYEPVWAIGTGKTATPEMAQAVHALIRNQIHTYDEAAAANVRILYGGSMKPDNASALLAMPDIDGGLIGGASLKAGDFLAIISAAQPVIESGA